MMETNDSNTIRLAVLISGGGSTMVNIQNHILNGSLHAQIATVICSRDCVGTERAEELNLFHQTISPKSYSSLSEFSEAVFTAIGEAKANLVVLAGYLSKIEIPDKYLHRVMNIHPSLIPAFCGQGMYGHHVHEAVIARGCKVSGCTVHFCDNEYDHGPIILQKTVPVTAEDDADSLATRVQSAESEAYPEAIQLFAEKRLEVIDGKVYIQ